jgi:hypothetical protein
MTQYADLFEMSEDSRIEMIGKAAAAGNTVGVVLEKNQPKKIERYIKKITTRYPNVSVHARIVGPTDLVVTIKFGPKPN